MPALNYNYNYNYNYAAGGGGGGRRFRERFNTDYYTRIGATAGAVVVPAPSVPPSNPVEYPQFHANWNPDLHSYEYLDAFRKQIGDGWLATYKTAITTTAGLTPPHKMDQPTLNTATMEMLQWALEREPRFCEIIDQDDGDGAINYLLGMLEIDPARHPHTTLMISVGRRIGEYIVMCLKGEFMSPRPSQLSPAVTPMIAPPATPSFPAGHAVQAYLISYLIAYSLPNLPNHTRPSSPSYTAQASGLLFYLARRISENRVVAGLHYQVDIRAGIVAAIQCFNDIRQTSMIWTPGTGAGLNQLVAKEFPQYA